MAYFGDIRRRSPDDWPGFGLYDDVAAEDRSAGTAIGRAGANQVDSLVSFRSFDKHCDFPVYIRNYFTFLPAQYVRSL